MTFYDVVAPVYSAWAALTESRAHRRAREILGEIGCPDLLEVAVGTGTECCILSAAPGRHLCVGVDISVPMLKQSKRRIERSPGGCALLCQADARALPFQNASFDCLLSCYMMDLLPERDIPVVLREFHRVLRPGGRLVLAGMGVQSRVMQQVWMTLFRHIPALIGGCRPIDVAGWLKDSGWDIESEERITQAGLRSEVLAARATTSSPSITC